MSFFNFVLLVYLCTAYCLVGNEAGALTTGSTVTLEYPNKSNNQVKDGIPLTPEEPSPEQTEESLLDQTTPAYELVDTPSLDGRAAKPAAKKATPKPQAGRKAKPGKKETQKKSGKKGPTTKKPPTFSREMGLKIRRLNISSKVRIIGGKNALPNEFPYHVAFSQDGSTGCGASIINPHYVLTAAHCTAGFEAQYLMVTAGEHVLSKPEGHEQERNIVEVIDHEEYNPDNMHHDISILKLEKPFELNKYVQAVDLADPKFVATGTVTITGWGKNDVEDTTGSDRLQKIDLPVADHAQCAANYEEIEPNKPITDRQICAGYFDQDGKDACQGDSGGPAIVKEGKKFIQVGVTSFGIGCAIAGFPGIYTSVAKYRDWIDKIVKPEKANAVKKDPKTNKPEVKKTTTTKKPTSTTTKKPTSTTTKKPTSTSTKKPDVAIKTGNILKDKKDDKKDDKKTTKKPVAAKKTGNILKDIPGLSEDKKDSKNATDNSEKKDKKSTDNNKKQDKKATVTNKKEKKDNKKKG